jgi:hypothetical protein
MRWGDIGKGANRAGSRVPRFCGQNRGGTNGGVRPAHRELKLRRRGRLAGPSLDKWCERHDYHPARCPNSVVRTKSQQVGMSQNYSIEIFAASSCLKRGQLR